MDIRPATQADAIALTEVVRAAYVAYRKAGLRLPPVEDGIDEVISETPVWVAAEKSEILGGIVIRRDSGRVQVENLAVHPGAGGRGIGRALLKVAEGWARTQGADHLYLATHRDMAGTIAFYRRLGWQEVGSEGEKLYLAKALTDRGGHP